MKKLLFSLLVVVACGGSKPAPPSEPTPAPSEPAPTAMEPDQCIAQGGQVKGDIGDGKVACADGERELGRVNQGIEGAICCAPAAP